MTQQPHNLTRLPRSARPGESEILATTTGTTVLQRSLARTLDGDRRPQRLPGMAWRKVLKAMRLTKRYGNWRIAYQAVGLHRHAVNEYIEAGEYAINKGLVDSPAFSSYAHLVQRIDRLRAEWAVRQLHEMSNAGLTKQRLTAIQWMLERHLPNEYPRDIPQQNNTAAAVIAALQGRGSQGVMMWKTEAAAEVGDGGGRNELRERLISQREVDEVEDTKEDSGGL